MLFSHQKVVVIKLYADWHSVQVGCMAICAAFSADLICVQMQCYAKKDFECMLLKQKKNGTNVSSNKFHNFLCQVCILLPCKEIQQAPTQVRLVSSQQHVGHWRERCFRMFDICYV